MTATAHRCPANAPQRPELYQTLLVLAEKPDGVIEQETGRLWACFPAERKRYPLDLGVIDELEKLGWVSLDDGHDEVTVTARGSYWANRFIRLNGG